MALIKCFECGTEVSEYAEKCPTCGCPMSVIKEHNSKPKNNNPYLLVFNSGRSIDLTGLEDKIAEEDLKNWGIFYNVFKTEFGASEDISHLVYSILGYNDYKFPDNYQKLYDAVCEHNRRRHNNLPTIKCPTCGSTCVRRISSGAKWIGAVFGGWHDKTARSQFECEHCGYMW